MLLNESQVIKLIKNKSNQLGMMQAYESRLKVMSEPLFFTELESETGWSEIKLAIRNSITPEKYQKVLQYFSYPLAIVSISDDILEDLNRVFNGRNANFNIQYPNKRAEAQAQELLYMLNTRKYIEKVGRRAFKCKPQTIIVVDKDAMGVPYYVTVELDKLMSYELTPCKQHFKYIIFHHSEGTDEMGSYKKIAFYDDEYYRVVEVRDKKYSLILESPHNLGYCPARWFVDDPLNTKDDVKRYAPLAKVLGSMSEWQQFHAYSYYAEHYGVFPVVEYAAAVCENEFCVNGWVSEPMENGEMSTPTSCTTCSANKFSGAGTAIKINPKIDNDENDVSGYFRFISPPTGNLEFEQTKQDQRENFIKVNTTGFNDMMNKEAVNADQVRSLMEDRKKPLLKLAGILNRLHKWLVETSVKLAIDTQVKVHANYGTEWFLLTEAQLQELFVGAKAAGMPESEIDQIYKLLIETKYKGDPQTVHKLMIENNLNPAPYSTIEECYKKAEQGVMAADDLYIKANFTKFVSKFERENGSIVQFGSDITFQQKIDIIYNTFKNYVRDERDENDDGQLSEQQGDAESDQPVS
jgi:hypothetical protein